MIDPAGVAVVFRSEWPRLMSVLVRETGDVAVAEDLAAEAFEEAARRWAVDGRPDRPGAWLLTTARRRAIDRHRRDRRFAERMPHLVIDAADDGDGPGGEGSGAEGHDVVDDQLALVCGCCHPELDRDTRIALTLRVVAGLSTDQIARALLVTPAAMGRRLSRARKRLQGDGVRFAPIDRHLLSERLSVVAGVVFSIFTEGHTATTPASLVHGDLCDEALWLAELLHRLVDDDPEIIGLRALLLLTDSRRDARVDVDGRLVTLAEQDRSLWDGDKLELGRALLADAHRLGRIGPYQLLAAIAALHVAAPGPEPDWASVVGLYDVLVDRWPAPLYRLNRAIAVARRDGAGAGLAVIDDEIAGDGTTLRNALADYPYLHSTRGELLLELGRWADATEAFGRAMAATRNEVERRHLAERLEAVEDRRH